MTSAYQSTKSIIDKIKKLDPSLHQDIYNILKKYELNSTTNNNGIFFNMEDIDADILSELTEYLEQSQLSKETEERDELHDLNLTPKACGEQTAHPCENKITKVSLVEECQQVVDGLSPPANINVASVLSGLEKEKHDLTNKKTAINVFSAAKKKYSKPVVSESKCANSEILELDTT